MSVFDIPEARAFILHWGEMGTHWGVNRSVAQIHALLYLSNRPIHAEEICETLGLARSNVSNGVKELQGYGIVRRTHIEGDRRDHFVAETDLWEMLTRIVAERKKREIDPTLTKLRELEMQGPAGDDYAEARIAELREMIEMMTGFYEEMNKLETERLVKLMTFGRSIAGLIDKAGGAIPRLAKRT